MPELHFAAPAPTGSRRPSSTFLALLAACTTGGVISWAGWGNVRIAVFLFVVTAWMLSLCLHEYAHALTAFHSGDRSVAAKGYLTLDPLRYSDPMLSIGLPVLFVLLGGIGLPGGAVWIERDRIPGRLRHSLVSAAGPLVNVGFMLTACAVIALVAEPGPHEAFWAALAYLGLLQATASLLNLLPVPGLDGFGIVEPWLPRDTVRRAARLSPVGLLLVFTLLWFPAVNGVFFDAVHGLLEWLGLPRVLVIEGDQLFRFWTD